MGMKDRRSAWRHCGRGWWNCLTLYVSLLQDGYTALTFASQYDHINIVRFFLESGVQVNEVKHYNVSMCKLAW